MNNFEILSNPYCYYSGEPSHLARFIKDGKKYLCGWDTEYNLPRMNHNASVIKMADEKGYQIPIWVEVPDWLKNMLRVTP